MNVQVKRVRPNAVLPKFQSDLAAGFDLCACVDEPIIMTPGSVAKIPTGIAIYIGERGVCAVMHPRSGLGTKGLVLGNLTGVIDADYQGEVNIVAWNRNPEGRACIETFPDFPDTAWPVGTHVIRPGDRIAQLVFVPVFHPTLQVVEEFTEVTTRGANGFGSTGVSVDRSLEMVAGGVLDAEVTAALRKALPK